MKAEIIIDKECGTNIRLVAEDFTTPFNTKNQFGIYVVITNKNGEIKVIDTNDARPIPKNMTVEDYKNSNLRGIFSYVTYAEYFSVCKKLRSKLISVN